MILDFGCTKRLIRICLLQPFTARTLPLRPSSCDTSTHIRYKFRLADFNYYWSFCFVSAFNKSISSNAQTLSEKRCACSVLLMGKLSEHITFTVAFNHILSLNGFCFVLFQARQSANLDQVLTIHSSKYTNRIKTIWMEGGIESYRRRKYEKLNEVTI